MAKVIKAVETFNALACMPEAQRLAFLDYKFEKKVYEVFSEHMLSQPLHLMTRHRVMPCEPYPPYVYKQAHMEIVKASLAEIPELLSTDIPPTPNPKDLITRKEYEADMGLG